MKDLVIITLRRVGGDGMKNNKKILQVSIILFVISLCLYFYFNRITEVKVDDVTLKASIVDNSLNHMEDHNYILNVEIEKKKDCYVILYTHMLGLGDLSYFIEENKSFHIPDSMGGDRNTEQIASRVLKREGLMSDQQSGNLIGFWFPEEKGVYKSRIYFNLDLQEPVQSPKIVVVYYEERNGRIFSWTKLVDIEFVGLNK